MLHVLSKRKLIEIMVLLIVTLFSFLLSDEITDFKAYCWYVVIDVFLVIITTINMENPFSIYSLFISLLPLFHFGQVFLYVAHLPVDTSHSYDLFSMYSDNQLRETISFCLIGYNLIALAGLCVSKGIHEREQSSEIYSDEQRRVFVFGKILFWIILLPIIAYDVTYAGSGLVLGYSAKYMYQYGFLSDMDYYFPFAIFCLIIGAKSIKQWRGYFVYAMFRLILQMFTVGNRGTLVIYLILYIMAFITAYRQSGRYIHFTLAQKLAIVIGILLTCIMISFVAIIRGGDRISLSSFFDEYNVVSLFISEFGSTLITPILAHEYINTKGILLGKNYLGAIAAILPFSNIYLSDIRGYMNVGALLNPYSPLGGALGGSLFADMVIGFGHYGYWVAPIVGIVVARVSEKFDSLRSKAFIKSMLLYFCFGIFLYIRGNSEDIGLTIKRMLYMYVLYTMFSQAYNRLTSQQRRVRQ